MKETFVEDNDILKDFATQIYKIANEQAIQDGKCSLDIATIILIIKILYNIIILINKLSSESNKQKTRIFKTHNIFKKIWLWKLVQREFKDKKCEASHIYEAFLKYMKDVPEETASYIINLKLKGE